MVAAGKVKVNGQVAESPGSRIDPENDRIEVDGERILLDAEKIYILLNKLPGYLSTTTDLRGRKTVMDLMPDMDRRLYPVGRLDKDTEGLLLITNDGDLTYRLTHPKHHVNKVYLAWVDGNPTEKSLDRLRRGIMLKDGMTAPAGIERETDKDGVCLRVTIHEGRKRQIKRMFHAIGLKVERLMRIQIGTIELGDLKPGHFRYLTEEEVKSLKHNGNG